MAKLTDYVTASDIRKWLVDKSTETTVLHLACEIFTSHDQDFFDLKKELQRNGFSAGETGAVLSFLDAAIRHKSNV